MNRFVVIGLAVVAAVVGIAYFTNRGSQIRVEGKVQKTRLQKLDENSTLAAFDFRFTNPANYPFVVRRVTAICTAADGKPLTGETVSEDDARRIFEHYRANLGEKYNESLVLRDRIPPHATQDRMIAATFSVEPHVLEKRTGCLLRIDDVDGAYSEVREIVK